jgi:DNA-binding response OmpR family regulator
MRLIDRFSQYEIPLVQYLHQVLDDQGIETVVCNDNLAIVGMAERTVLDISPELWVVDETLADEAAAIVRELRQSWSEAPPDRS